MNIFFYTPQKSAQASAAFEWLCALHLPLDIRQLPSGSGFSSNEALHLRSGDLVILFARDQRELEALLQLRNECGNFKIILMFQDYDQELLKQGQLLNPRYCAFASHDYIHAEETIRKIVT